MINWRSTSQQLQTLISGQSLSLGQTSVAQALLAAITDYPGQSGAGPNYDRLANDGAGAGFVRSPIQAAFHGWFASALSTSWTELDRLARYTYSLAFSPFGQPSSLVATTLANNAKAAFGIPGVAIPWTPTTLFAANFISPAPSNGFYYQGTSSTGTSGSTQPTWPTTLGATVTDGAGGTMETWTCTAAIGTSATTPAVLAPDETLLAVATLNARYQQSIALCNALNQLGLASSIQVARTNYVNALAAQPPSNPTIDAASTAAVQALQTALANAAGFLASIGFA